MQARPRFITTLFAISAATLVAGCGDSSQSDDPLAAVSEQYRTLLRERPVIREQADATDDTAGTLRQLAGQAQAAGREGDEQAAALLTAGIRSTAGTLEYDEAMRAESQAASLRQLVRALAADADRLATAAENAEQLDIGKATILLENELARAREAYNAADAELADLKSKTDAAASERDEMLAVAAELDASANESAEIAVELGPIEARDHWISASHFRGEAHQARVAAALSEISIQTIAPTMVLADARRAGQSEVINAARDARQTAESRVDDARAYAEDVRTLVSQLAAAAAERLERVNELETTRIIPGLEASISDFEAAGSAARALTRGGSREESAAGWRAIANAQFGVGRAQWEIATIQGRRSDLFARLAAGGSLADAATAVKDAEAAFDARKSALEAAETAFNEALASLGNIQGDDAAAMSTRSTIERAISGVKGEVLEKPALSMGTSSGGGGGVARTASGGGGFGTPAEVANFLSDSNNMLLPAAFARLESALKAETAGGQSVKKLLTSAGFAAPLIAALSEQFGEEAVMTAMGEGMGGGFSVGPGMEMVFAVDGVDGDTATLKSKDGSQTLILAKSASGWVIDLDATVEGDPNMKMMVQMMGPMLDQMLAPMRQATEAVTVRVQAGEFDSLEEAMDAVQESMESAQPGGRPSGLPGGF